MCVYTYSLQIMRLIFRKKNFFNDHYQGTGQSVPAPSVLNLDDSTAACTPAMAVTAQ